MEQYCIVAKKYGVNVDHRMLNQKFPAAFKKIRDAYPLYGKKCGITPDQWWEYLIKDLFSQIEASDEMVREILTRFEGVEAYTVYPDVRNFLERVKREHPNVILGIISNTDPKVCNLLENLQLKHYFGKHIYLSYDLEVKKPDQRIFHAAFEDIVKRNQYLLKDMTLDELKSRVWHVGDEKMTDFEGAHSAGFNSVLVDRINEFGYFGKHEDSFMEEKSLTWNDARLSLRKVCNDSEGTWRISMAQKDIIKVSARQYVITNFDSLEALLF